jgi:hypothetical protein
MSNVDGLKPNADIMYDVLSQWFRECHLGEIEIGWRADGKLNRFKRFGLDEIEELAAFCADTNSRPGQNMYWRPATVTGRLLGSECPKSMPQNAQLSRAPSINSGKR